MSISTPAQQVHYCKKVPHATQAEARRVAADLEERRGYPLRVYRCPDCARYHLTKQVKR